MAELIKTAVSMDLGGFSIAQNVFYHTLEDGVDVTNPTIANNVVADMVDLYQNAYGNFISAMPAQVSIDTVEVWYVDNTAPWSLAPLGQGTIGLAGTAPPGQMIAQGVALLVKGYSLLGGRPAMKFIAGLGEALFVDGAASTDLISRGLNFAGAAYGLWTGVTAGYQYTPMIVNEKLGTSRQLLGNLAIGVYAAYQRRRKPGVGM